MSETPPPSVQSTGIVAEVIGFVGLVALVGYLAVVFLIHEGSDAALVAIAAGPPTTALGILGGILAHTAVAGPVKEQQQAIGYQQAVADVQALDTASPAVPAPVPPEPPIAPPAEPPGPGFALT